MGLLTFISRLNATHPWSHNDAYSGFVLRHARSVRRGGGSVAVDAGCGTGNLLERLSDVFPTVVGIEPDIGTADAAVRRFQNSKVVTVESRTFGSEPHKAYDFIVFVASLHHMPLNESLQSAREALRSGGRIVIVGVARETARDAARSLVSALLNPIVGILRHPRRAGSAPPHMKAPTMEAAQSFDEVRAIAAATLPGILMRRRLFWRYTAVWTAPEARRSEGTSRRSGTRSGE